MKYAHPPTTTASDTSVVKKGGNLKAFSFFGGGGAASPPKNSRATRGSTVASAAQDDPAKRLLTCELCATAGCAAEGGATKRFPQRPTKPPSATIAHNASMREPRLPLRAIASIGSTSA